MCAANPFSLKRLRMDKNRFEEETQLLLEEDSRPKKGRGRWVLVLLILGGLSYGGYRWWRVARPAAADATTAQPEGGGRGRGGRGRGGGGGRPAVVTITARKSDMPVYLRGLGTVTAFNTVTVR